MNAAETQTAAETELMTLAYDHALVVGIEDPEGFARSCRWVYRMIQTQTFGIDSGMTAQCAMLAEMGFISGPTSIASMAFDDVWAAA